MGPVKLEQIEQHWRDNGTLHRAHIEGLLEVAKAAEQAWLRGWHGPGCVYTSQLRHGLDNPWCGCGRAELIKAVQTLEGEADAFARVMKDNK
jgi:hypothetical protein